MWLWLTHRLSEFWSSRTNMVAVHNSREGGAPIARSHRRSLSSIFNAAGTGPEKKEDELIPGQGGWQLFLLLIAFFAVPWMLLPKPLILKKRHEAMQAAKVRWCPHLHGRVSGPK